MAKASSKQDEGVASFSYCPADESLPLLFEFARPLSELADMLMQHFTGRTVTMLEVYKQHQVGKPFIKKNYKDALVRLEANGRIKANPPAAERRPIKGQPTFADEVLVSFPAEG